MWRENGRKQDVVSPPLNFSSGNFDPETAAPRAWMKRGRSPWLLTLKNIAGSSSHCLLQRVTEAGIIILIIRIRITAAHESVKTLVKTVIVDLMCTDMLFAVDSLIYWLIYYDFIFSILSFIPSVLPLNYGQHFGNFCVYLKLCFINKTGLDLSIVTWPVKESNHLLAICMNK